MKNLHRIAAALLAALMICLFCACKKENPASSKAQPSVGSAAQTEAGTESTSVPETMIPMSVSGNKTLVAYFSATGTTKEVAQRIAAQINADTYEITPEQPYSAADLDYNNSDARASKEQNDPDARPAVAGEVLTTDEYAVIYLGYPVWFGQAPRILDTFTEQYDFSGKIIIPFCTSISSPIGDSAASLKAHTDGATWLEGRRFGAEPSDEEINSFLGSSNL